ncbi:MAG: hypothetical protein ACE5H4_09305 [Candidatus Thorarchaeota archaeon]
MTEIPMPEDYGEPPRREERKGFCEQCCTCSIQAICAVILIFILFILILVFTGVILLF